MRSNIELIEKTTQSEDNLTSSHLTELLLIEQDGYLSDVFANIEHRSNYHLTSLPTEEGISSDLRCYLLDNNPEMIVIDVGNLDRSRLRIINDIRMLYHGLLVVLANHYNETDQIEALKLGVDAYIARPKDNKLLTMNISALLRRKGDKGNQVALASITLGDVCLLPKSQKCFINGHSVKLTTFEFNLLKLLLERQGQILSRDKLYTTLLGRIYNGVERTLDVRMSQLREKLTVAGMQKNQIETVWGQGYMFSQEEA